MNVWRQVRRQLRSHRSERPIRLFEKQRDAFETARVVVRCYYAALFYFAVRALGGWPGYLDREASDPLWPLCWLRYLPEPAWGVHLIMLVFLTGTVAAAGRPGARWARIPAFVGVLLYVAFQNSFGKIGHSMHLWVITAFLLVFLPAGWLGTEPCDRVRRQKTLLAFWSCQALILLTYSMAGLGKVLGGVQQFLDGQVHAFAREAMAAHVAARLMETNSRSVLGPWFIEHPLVGWFTMWAAIYLQLCAFWVAFRPRLHRVWAWGLILFHVGTDLTMTVGFSTQVLLVGLFLFVSPFQPADSSWRALVRDLPILGAGFRWLQRWRGT